MGREAGADSAWFAIVALLAGFGCAPFVGDSIERHTPASAWDHVFLSGTQAQRLGVTRFDALLTAIGWNRMIASARHKEAQSSASILPNPRPIRAGALGHAWALGLHLICAALACIHSGWVVGVLLIATGILLHAYPTLLQMRTLTRLRPLKARYTTQSAETGSGGVDGSLSSSRSRSEASHGARSGAGLSCAAGR